MTPTQARAFHAVGKEGSFTGAARALNVSQPTITTQVRELEKTYGVELFLRSSAGARLTETGSVLYRMVDQWQSLHRECQEFLSSARALKKGRLTIGTYGPYDAIDLTVVMQERYPGIEVSVVFSNSNTLKDQLRSHDIDVAIMSGVHYDDCFQCMKYRRRRLVALLPKDHRWAARHDITIDELAAEPLISRERGSAVRQCLEIAASQKNVSLHWSAEIGSREGIVAAAQRGLGIGVIFEEGHIPTETVSVVPLKNLSCDATVDVVCLAERASNRLIKCFTDLAASEAVAHGMMEPA